MEKRQSLQQMVLGKLDSDMQKNEPGPLSYTVHKNKLKWIKDLHMRQEAIKILEEKTGNNLFDLRCSNFLLISRGKGNKSKNELLGSHQDQKLQHRRRKQSAKLKGYQRNGRRYLQMAYQIKA